MGKNLIQQARGKGGPTYRSPSFNFRGDIRHPPLSENVISGVVKDIVHCAGHSAPLIIVQYEKETLLNLAPEGIKVGDRIECGSGVNTKAGNILPLSDIPDGTIIYNIESVPGDGGKFARSSGGTARLISKYGNRAKVMLPSKREKTFLVSCRAAIGTPAGGGRTEKVILKAGNNYHKKRARNKLWPRSSASKMNAVDHPFGNSRSLRKSKAKPTSRFAPPGRKVGMVRARRSGQRKGRSR
ncbi:50S ribosomal protein L2 [Candidatus Woesearchaeota archaeon]|nr:50S ribosomal protein L2 [Candidatus Woesearchaeota archaeon]